MYVRLGTSNFNYSNALLPAQNYSKLNEAQHYCKTDRTKFVISNSVYNEKIQHPHKLKLESQFFDKIKVPEQGHVIQRPIAKDGR